ncbi:dipeptidase family protein [Gottschalkia purinilytica]|uniref:Dipeptidase family protein n=1 Tax=Gottschalkia purinilytica TaxID=1503 RepID=A0A0L0W7W2_GOTPU|nr:dipeptidase [Gottschalkia purinilytica]KNF07526.1 dipeptidase family protein [Gottschalkia purinilytica]
MIFDGHADIWTDVNVKRKKGFKDIFKSMHLERFKKGNINGGIFIVWPEPPYNENTKNRVIHMIENMSTEIMENQDLIHIVKQGCDLDKGIRQGKMTVIIGLEGLSYIGKNVDLIDTLYMLGARHASLTWNEENELATGIDGDPNRGLTKHGINVIRKMERLGMIIDVSHANEKTFWDIYENTSKPFIASHSNCKTLCNVPRNITDRQLRAIGKRKGIVGLNVYREFVHEDKNKQNLKYLINHIDHMVDTIGIDSVAFGFDFCEYLEDDSSGEFSKNPTEINTIGVEDASQVGNIINELIRRGYTTEDIEKISYKNFFRVIKTILK